MRESDNARDNLEEIQALCRAAHELAGQANYGLLQYLLEITLVEARNPKRNGAPVKRAR